MKNSPSKYLDQFTVRLPEGWRDKIKMAAIKNKRSMNNEIIHQLEKAYDAEENRAA